MKMDWVFRCMAFSGALALCFLATSTSFGASYFDQPSVSVTSIDKIEIIEVNTAKAVASIQMDVTFQVTADTNVTQVAPQDFSIDGVDLLLSPYKQPISLKQKQSSPQTLTFDTPLTVPMIALMKKFGQSVHASGSFHIEGTQSRFVGSKNIILDVPVDSSAMFAQPKPDTLAKIQKVMNPEAVVSDNKHHNKPAPPPNPNPVPTPNPNPNPPPNPAPAPMDSSWMLATQQQAASNVVVIESSVNVAIASVPVERKLYRQGYRLTDMEVVAPLDLNSPLTAQVGEQDSAMAATAASFASQLGDPALHAWVADGAGSGAPQVDHQSLPINLSFKCNVHVSGGDLGIYEFRSRPPVRYSNISEDTGTSPNAPTMELSYKGLSASQPFSIAALSAIPESGTLNGAVYSLPHQDATAWGSPVFSNAGLLAIVNGPNGAVTAAEIRRVAGSCIGAPTPAPSPTPSPSPNNLLNAYEVKMVSTPAGATVWLDHALLDDGSGHPIVTAASKETCTSANTAHIAKGRHYLAFIYEGYKQFAGYVMIDDDMVVSGKLVKEK